jgi:lysophospholipid acyltransferase
MLKIISNGSGISEDKLLIGFGSLLLFPLNFIFMKVKGVNLRHHVNILFGIGIGYLLMGMSGFVHSIISSLIVYLICKFMNNLKRAATVVWIWSILYVLISHIVRTIYHTDGHMLDYSVIQMMLTCKLTAFASNLYYATLGEKNEYWTKHQISRLPSLTEFFGYVFFYQTYLIGPFVEYKDYIDYIHDDKNSQHDNGKALVWPSQRIPGLVRLLQSLIVLMIMLMIDRIFPYEYLFHPEFLNRTILYRLLYCYMVTLAFKLSYQFIWTFVNSSLIFSGFAFSGYDNDGFYSYNINGIPKWDKANNVDLTFEFSSVAQELPMKWNITVGQWLRHYCYERFETDEKVKAMFITNILSALWHGVYPGYYMSFFMASVLIATGREWHKKVHPIIEPYCSNDMIKFLYKISNIMLLSSLVFLSFMALTFTDSVRIYGSLYFIPQILIFGSWFILSKLPSFKNKLI